LPITRPVVDEAVPEHLAAVGCHAIIDASEGSVESHVINVMSFPSLYGDLTHLVSYDVHYLQYQHTH